MNLDEAYQHTFKLCPATCPEVRAIVTQLAHALPDQDQIKLFKAIRGVTNSMRDAWAQSLTRTLIVPVTRGEVSK